MIPCEYCKQIIDTEQISLSVPTIFNDIGFEGSLCASCKSMMEWVCYRYNYQLLN